MAPSLSTLQPTSRRVVVLRHEPEDPGMPPHFDLMLEPGHPAADDVPDVPTWRCEARPDRLEVGTETMVTPIAPHRRWWLGQPPEERIDLRPPLGRAWIVARGVAEFATEDASGDESRVRVRWSDETRVVEFRMAGSRLRCLAPPPEASCNCSPGDGSCC
jgi:hypothetical protein